MSAKSKNNRHAARQSTAALTLAQRVNQLEEKVKKLTKQGVLFSIFAAIVGGGGALGYIKYFDAERPLNELKTKEKIIEQVSKLYETRISLFEKEILNLKQSGTSQADIKRLEGELDKTKASFLKFLSDMIKKMESRGPSNANIRLSTFDLQLLQLELNSIGAPTGITKPIILNDAPAGLFPSNYKIRIRDRTPATSNSYAIINISPGTTFGSNVQTIPADNEHVEINFPQNHDAVFEFTTPPAGAKHRFIIESASAETGGVRQSKQMKSSLIKTDGGDPTGMLVEVENTVVFEMTWSN